MTYFFISRNDCNYTFEISFSNHLSPLEEWKIGNVTSQHASALFGGNWTSRYSRCTAKCPCLWYYPFTWLQILWRHSIACEKY